MSAAKPRNVSIILASGTRARFRSETPKQFLKLAGRTVLKHTLDILERRAGIDEVIVLVQRRDACLRWRTSTMQIAVRSSVLVVIPALQDVDGSVSYAINQPVFFVDAA